jgi:hypothetical protein
LPEVLLAAAPVVELTAEDELVGCEVGPTVSSDVCVLDDMEVLTGIELFMGNALVLEDAVEVASVLGDELKDFPLLDDELEDVSSLHEVDDSCVVPSDEGKIVITENERDEVGFESADDAEDR